jgi:hypothetical protein
LIQAFVLLLLVLDGMTVDVAVISERRAEASSADTRFSAFGGRQHLSIGCCGLDVSQTPFGGTSDIL